MIYRSPVEHFPQLFCGIYCDIQLPADRLLSLAAACCSQVLEYSTGTATAARLDRRLIVILHPLSPLQEAR